MTTRANQVIHTTQALCPDCDAVLPATLVERERDVFLELHCPRHGRTSNLYYRDADLYRRLHALRNPVTCCDTYDCARGAACARRRDGTMIYMLNVTNNCNLACQACYSGSGEGRHEPDRPADELLAGLPDTATLAAAAPHAVFIGGEPTLHAELPAMIRRVREQGYIPRVATNGLKLADTSYVRELADAGLQWVFLHFDSLDDGLNRRLRGRPLRAPLLAAIDNSQAAGMKVQLGITVARENLHELLALLQVARRRRIFWVSLYPVAGIERSGSGTIHLTDVLDALGQQSGGQLRRADFLAAARLWSALHRLTGRHNYRQKPTMLSLPVIWSGEAMVPITRLLSPLGALRHPAALARLLAALPALRDYERRPPSPDTMVLNVQQFQSRHAFDLQEATHNLMSYAHEGSFLPFDIFNHVHRYEVA